MPQSVELWIVDFLRTLMETVGWAGVVLAMAVESANVPLPSEVTMPLAGWMLVRDRGLGMTGLLLAGFYGALGNTLGSLVNYYLGRWGGRPLLSRYGRWVLVSEHDLDRADRWFARWGDAIAFFSRLLPVVRTFVSFPAGMARMNVVKFTIYTFLGSFLWSCLLAYLGYAAGANWERIRAAMRPFDYPIILVILLLVGWYVYRKLRAQRSPQDAVPG